MNEEEKIKREDILYNELVEFVKQNCSYFSDYEFSFFIFLFFSKMVFDIAPNVEEAKEMMNKAISQGLQWSNDEKKEDE